MFTLAFVVCMFGDTECYDAVKDSGPYASEAACDREAAALNEWFMENYDGEGIAMTRCVNWGAPT